MALQLAPTTDSIKSMDVQWCKVTFTAAASPNNATTQALHQQPKISAYDCCGLHEDLHNAATLMRYTVQQQL